MVFAAPAAWDDPTDIMDKYYVTGVMSDGTNNPTYFSLNECELSYTPPGLQNFTVYCANESLSLNGTIENYLVTGASLWLYIYPSDCSMFSSGQLENIYFGLTTPFDVNYTTGEFRNSTEFHLSQLQVDSALSIYTIVPFQIENYIIEPDYLKRGKSQNATKATLQPLQTTYTTATCNTGYPLAQLQYVLAPTSITTTIVYTTIIELISSLGALWTTGFGIIAGFFHFVNKCHQRRLKKLTKASPENAVELDIHALKSGNAAFVELTTPRMEDESPIKTESPTKI